MIINQILVAFILISRSRGSSPPLDIIDNIPEKYLKAPRSNNLELTKNDVPGEPLTPDDFRMADSVGIYDDPIVDDEMPEDPIYKAGLFEGDIDNIPDEDYIRVLESSAALFKNETLNAAAVPRNAIRDNHRKWPGGIIPYIISSSYSHRDRGIIARAIKLYEQRTCLKFIPRTSQKSYIHIIKGSGCSSSVGRTGGVQTLSLGNGCVYTGIVIHELMHAAGFWHEQSRADRDDYVNIIWKNIMPNMMFNFFKYNLNKIDHLKAPYDTCSVMHYGPTAFSVNHRLPTIKVKQNTGCQLGQRQGFSDIDVKKINTLYNCYGYEQTGFTTKKPETTLKPTEEKCTDSNKYCATWAKNGECLTNPAWMLKNCQISCKECKNKCKDHHPDCSAWAAQGECSGNIHYMKLYCLKSCKLCTSTETNCRDEKSKCPEWASKGFCTSNNYQSYMKLRCRKSCKFC